MFKKINTLLDKIRTVEDFNKPGEFWDLLMEVDENFALDIIRLKLRMMEELIHKGLDMKAIERILHIKRRKDA